jgi:tetratricopeptide (TPR) repeat protein
MRAVASVALCLAALMRPAGADEPDDAVALARAHFQRGSQLYGRGDYAGSLREFSAGYEIAPRPEFLLNIGQAHRKLGDLPRARAFFEKYLASTPDSEPRRAQVKLTIAEIASELARVGPAAPAPAPVAAAAPAPASPSVRSEPRRRSRLWWLMLPAAVLVAAGAAVGIALAVAPRSYCGSGALDCLDLSQVR